jgi:hypothetical protein
VGWLHDDDRPDRRARNNGFRYSRGHRTHLKAGANRKFGPLPGRPPGAQEYTQERFFTPEAIQLSS